MSLLSEKILYYTHCEMLSEKIQCALYVTMFNVHTLQIVEGENSLMLLQLATRKFQQFFLEFSPLVITLVSQSFS